MILNSIISITEKEIAEACSAPLNAKYTVFIQECRRYGVRKFITLWLSMIIGIL